MAELQQSGNTVVTGRTVMQGFVNLSQERWRDLSERVQRVFQSAVHRLQSVFELVELREDRVQAEHVEPISRARLSKKDY